MIRLSKRGFVAVLLAVLLVSFCSVFYVPVVVAGTPAGTITYSAVTDTITVVGANSSHPAEFLDLYNADLSGGWGQIVMQGLNQFDFNCKVQIGNGSTLTYFTDYGKQLEWNFYNLTYDADIFQAKANATVTLGILINETSKSTKAGCTIISANPDGWNSHFRFDTGSFGYLYSCNFICYRYSPVSFSSSEMFIQGEVRRIWNFMGSQTCFYDVSSCSFYNVLDTNVVNEGLFYGMGPGNTYDTIRAYSCGTILRDGMAASKTYSNVFSRDSPYVYTSSNVGSEAFYFINPDIDIWAFSWGSATGEIYRQYSLDLYVLNGALTDFVEDANVTLTHDGTIYGTWLTNSTGQISTQTLTYGFYNQTGGNTMYGGTAWTLTITHPDWQTYTSKFYPYAKMDWSISMQERVAAYGLEDNDANLLVVLLIVAIAAVSGILIWKR